MNKYPYHQLAQVIVELTTPLALGSGEKDLVTDATVATDCNGLPYLPGTSITGVIRSLIGEKESEKLFGWQKSGANDSGEGSRIAVSDGKILNASGEVMDGLILLSDIKKDPLLEKYLSAALPIRDHVRINEKGVADDKGKFDQQVVYAGTRFCFELDAITEEEKDADFDKVIETLCLGAFRLGGGTRNGFGSVKVVDLQTKTIGPENIDEYLEKSSHLGSDFWSKELHCREASANADWDRYRLELTPDDFILFGSGLTDEDFAMTAVKEPTVVWKGRVGSLRDAAKCYFIPGTSVKGAVSHRVAYHWNKMNEHYAGHPNVKFGTENKAVRGLFGYVDKNNARRGNVIFSDTFLTGNELVECSNPHVAIDRFTGGAIDSALYTEKNIYAGGQTISIEILAKKSVLDKPEDKGIALRKPFEAALKDICMGLLPLGGGVNRGNGIFTGKLFRNEEVI